jgi:hypothetical protein
MLPDEIHEARTHLGDQRAPCAGILLVPNPNLKAHRNPETALMQQ